MQPQGASQPRKQLDGWQDWAKQRGARGLAYVLVGEDGELGGPVAKNISESERAGLVEAVGASAGDAVFFAAGEPADARALLGAARAEIARRGGLIDESAWAFCWVNDAPLFELAARTDDVAVGSAPGPPSTMPSPHPSRSGSTGSRSRRGRHSRTRMTWCATETRSAAVRSVSTSATCSSGCSR